MSCELTVIIPTVTDRERPWRQRVIDAYLSTLAGVDWQLVVVEDLPWGYACQAGLTQARGRYALLAADDGVPQPGWWPQARRALEQEPFTVWSPYLRNMRDGVEAPLSWLVVLANDDRPKPEQVDRLRPPFATFPVASREVWREIGPLCPTHEHSDGFITERVHRLNMDSKICAGWVVEHHQHHVAQPLEDHIYRAWCDLYLNRGAEH